MEKEWKRELARDVLALGSWVFYVIVIARALIQPYRPFVDQMVIAAVVLILIGFVFKEWDGYVAKGLVLVVFTSIFYNSDMFTGFVVVVGLLMVWSSYFVGNSWKKVGLGLVVGALGVVVGWYGGGYSAGLF